jgi:hypothetical protein
MAPTGTSPTTLTPGAIARKAFLADLTRAMRIAAEEQRETVLAQLRGEAESSVNAMQDQASAAAEAARGQGDADVATLEEWCAEELRRIRRETDQSIADRRAQLEAELAAQTERLASGVVRVEQTVAGFENQMATFFKRLLAEEDPTKFAGLAERMPEPPAFAAWSPTAPEEVEAPTPPEATAAEETPTTARGALKAADLAALDAEAMAAAEAEALEDAGMDAADEGSEVAAVSDGSATTRAVVCALGLVSVASVSAFKRMLARADGVHSVQVTSGPQGEFVFTITCDPEMDLAAVVAGLPGFQIDLRSVTQGRVDITARELDQPS